MNIKTYKPEAAKPVSMEGKLEVAPKQYKAPKVELSENIKKFDNRPRAQGDPFAYNTISLKKTSELNESASDLLVQPLYNKAGHMFGIDMAHDWGRKYDKVYKVIQIAKEQTGETDTDKLLSWVYGQINNAPSVSNNRLDDVYVYLSMGAHKPKENKEPEKKTITKTKIVTKYVNKKDDTKTYVNNWIKKIINVN